MGKIRQSTKEAKKPAALSLKEKREKKQAKKQGGGSTPLVVPKQ